VCESEADAKTALIMLEPNRLLKQLRRRRTLSEKNVVGSKSALYDAGEEVKG
jgi:hypothetical protein